MPGRSRRSAWHPRLSSPRAGRPESSGLRRTRRGVRRPREVWTAPPTTAAPARRRDWEAADGRAPCSECYERLPTTRAGLIQDVDGPDAVADAANRHITLSVGSPPIQVTEAINHEQRALLAPKLICFRSGRQSQPKREESPDTEERLHRFARPSVHHHLLCWKATMLREPPRRRNPDSPGWVRMGPHERDRRDVYQV